MFQWFRKVVLFIKLENFFGALTQNAIFYRTLHYNWQWTKWKITAFQINRMHSGNILYGCVCTVHCIYIYVKISISIISYNNNYFNTHTRSRSHSHSNTHITVHHNCAFQHSHLWFSSMKRLAYSGFSLPILTSM